MTKIRWMLLLAVLLLAAGGIYLYWQHEMNFPNTSDAYITAHVVHIVPQISGQVIDIPVKDHQHVNLDQLLVKIDSHAYQIAVQKAQAELALAHQEKLAADAAVIAANALINQRQAQFKDAQRTYNRDTRLLEGKALSRAQAESDKDKFNEMQAAVQAAQAGYQQSIGQQAQARAHINVAMQVLNKAQLDLSYTTIRAPVAGILGKIGIRPGDVLQVGQQLFPLVEDKTFWVVANYKETDLERIRPGQPATINVDMYPSQSFHGVVESLSPASGVAFSLLPPENATGNWVKVTQRFPVRIRMIDSNKDWPLRIGASCSVTIDTRHFRSKDHVDRPGPPVDAVPALPSKK
ncbi:MAG: HlyD family secretion protein [Proteobacteria bacterium]|nr:HlyD family secretion protein [Pseudomonadota bacterium]